MADPISDLVGALTSNLLCLLGAVSFVILLIILVVVLHIKKVQKESEWAYNPDKKLRLRWRRG